MDKICLEMAWMRHGKERLLHKGDPIIVEGAIQTRSYEDKNGNRRTAVEVVAAQVYLERL